MTDIPLDEQISYAAKQLEEIEVIVGIEGKKDIPILRAILATLQSVKEKGVEIAYSEYIKNMKERIIPQIEKDELDNVRSALQAVKEETEPRGDAVSFREVHGILPEPEAVNEEMIEAGLAALEKCQNNGFGAKTRVVNIYTAMKAKKGV